MKKRNLLIVMLALIMCLSSTISMVSAASYTYAEDSIAGGTMIATG